MIQLRSLGLVLPMWIYAYGSLIFRPSFEYLERRRAFLPGWARRFWQGSPDHRGVPDAPGRVVTLVPSPGESCGGCAYRIDPASADQVLGALDAREQAGFDRLRRGLRLESCQRKGRLGALAAH